MKHCSRCKNPRAKKARYCLTCKSAYMREWRKSHPLNEKQKKKDIARSYLNVYVKRGKIIRKVCEICGEKAEAHHPDYNKPLDVRWLCRLHHLEHHKKLTAKSGG